MSPRLRGRDTPATTGPHTRPSTPAGRWRCLIKGCWDYGRWQTLTGREDTDHYLREHYDPVRPAPGTHPDEIGPDGRLHPHDTSAAA